MKLRLRQGQKFAFSPFFEVFWHQKLSKLTHVIIKKTHLAQLWTFLHPFSAFFWTLPKNSYPDSNKAPPQIKTPFGKLTECPNKAPAGFLFGAGVYEFIFWSCLYPMCTTANSNQELEQKRVVCHFSLHQPVFFTQNLNPFFLSQDNGIQSQ